MPDYLLKNTEQKNIMFKPIPYSLFTEINDRYFSDL